MKLVLALKLVPKFFSQHHTAFDRKKKKKPACKLIEAEDMLEKGAKEEALNLVLIQSLWLIWVTNILWEGFERSFGGKNKNICFFTVWLNVGLPGKIQEI